jgi:hypothetical protein
LSKKQQLLTTLFKRACFVKGQQASGDGLKHNDPDLEQVAMVYLEGVRAPNSSIPLEEPNRAVPKPRQTCLVGVFLFSIEEPAEKS